MKILAIAVMIAVAASAADRKNVLVYNVLVYKEPGRFGGWPANHGIWSWGNEIVVGFSAAYFKHMPLDRHQYDDTKPEEPRLARSLDGGNTWTIEAPKSLLPPEQGGAAATDLKQPMDFRNPNFAMTIRFLDKDKGASLLLYSTDRGKSWHGAYNFPTFGTGGGHKAGDQVRKNPRQKQLSPALNATQAIHVADLLKVRRDGGGSGDDVEERSEERRVG